MLHLRTAGGAAIVAIAACPVTPPAPAAQIHAVALTSSDTDVDALIVGASGLPTPPPGYMDAANTLYLGSVDNTVGVYSPESFWPLTGVTNMTTDVSINAGAQNLAAQIEADVSPGKTLEVFGYSQGADVLTKAMQQIYADGVPADEVHFVMLGDPQNPDGGLLSRFGVDIDGSYPTVPGLGITFDGPTPVDGYATDIYTYEYDGFADQPLYPIDLLSDLNALLGMAFNHGDYLGPDAVNSAFLLSSDDATNYYMIPSQTLPLLAPLQFIPLIGKPLYDLLEPDTRILVNLGYGSITDGWDPSNSNTVFGFLPGNSADFNWSQVLPALAAGLQTGINTAIADFKDGLSYGPSVMDVPALHQLLQSAYNMVDAGGPAADPSAIADLTGVQLWQGIVSQLEPGGNAFDILQGAFPGMIPDPPTTLSGLLNDVATNIDNDIATLIPIANTVTTLLTTIPGIAASFISEASQGGNLGEALGDALSALVGLAPIGLGVGTVVPVVEALAINALNFAEAIDPNALQDLASLLVYIP